MDAGLIEGVILTPLKVINVPGGDVLHAMKSGDSGFKNFGEAYFSTIESGVIKAWKRHRDMTLNIVVPVGKINFVMFDSRYRTSSYGLFQSVSLSRDNYARLTIPPMVWVGFQGISEDFNLLLNIADLPHSHNEVDRKNITEINYDWSSNKH